MRPTFLISMALMVLVSTSVAEARRTSTRRAASHLYRWSKFQAKRLTHNLGKDADERLSNTQFGKFQKLDPGQRRSYLASHQRAVLAKKLKRARAAVSDLLKNAKRANRYAARREQAYFDTASREVTTGRSEAAHHLSDAHFYAKKRGLSKPSSLRVLARRVFRGMKLQGEADATAQKNKLYVPPPSRDTSAIVHEALNSSTLYSLAK